jgi:CBS domain-containing protein/sporulation protein YlmC with PRC-barrel domain
MSGQVLVRDQMAPPTETIQTGHNVIAAKQRMQADMRVKSLIVIEGDRPVGMLRYNDVNQEGALQSSIEELMVRDVPTVRAEQPLEELTGLMTQYDVDRLPVVNDSGALVGELPRAALTLGETHGTESVITEPRLSDTQSLQATPAFDIRKDMAVVGTGGSKIGKVKEVLSDQLSGSLTHVVVHTGLLFGKDKSVPADLIDNVEGDEVCLKVDKAEIDMLPDLNAEA